MFKAGTALQYQAGAPRVWSWCHLGLEEIHPQSGVVFFQPIKREDWEDPLQLRIWRQWKGWLEA